MENWTLGNLLHDCVVQPMVIIGSGMIGRIVKSPAFFPLESTLDDEQCYVSDITQLKQRDGHACAPIIFFDLFADDFYSSLGSLQAVRAANDAYIIPHELPNLLNVMLDHDPLFGVLRTGFVPRHDLYLTRRKLSLFDILQQVL